MSLEVRESSLDNAIKITIEPPPSSLPAEEGHEKIGSSPLVEEGIRSMSGQQNDEHKTLIVSDLKLPPLDYSPLDKSSTSDFSINSSRALLNDIVENDVLDASHIPYNADIPNNKDPSTTIESCDKSNMVVSFAESVENIVIKDEVNIEELKKKLKQSQYRHMFSRFLMTAAYFTVMFAFGASQSIVGPCLSFLTVNVGQTSSTIGWIFTLKGLGSIAGTLFGGKVMDIIAEQLSNFRGCLYEWKKKRKLSKGLISADPLDTEKEIEKIRALPPFKKYIARNYAIHSYFAVCVLILVASLVATPFIRDFGLLLFVYFIFGLGSGLTIMQGNVLCAWLWGQYAATALLLNSAVVGLGAFLCPIILNGLIATDSTSTLPANSNSSISSFGISIEQTIMETFDNNSTSTEINAILNGNWRFTYVLIGGLMLLSILVILPLFQIILTKFELFRLHGIISVDGMEEEKLKETIEGLTKKPQEEEIEMKASPSMITQDMITSESTADFLEKEAQREKEDELQEKEIKEELVLGKVISKIVHWYHQFRTYRAFVLFALGFFFAFGIETTVGGLISTYLIEYVGTSDISQASLMVSIYYLSMTIARVVSGIFSYFLQKVFKFTQLVVLIISYVGLLSGIIVMLTIPQNSMVGAWIGVIIIGASISTFIPGYISYPSATEMRDVHLTGFLTSILFVLSSVGEMIIPLLITNCFSWFGFYSFFWVILIVAILMGLITLWLFFMSLELRARIFSLFNKKKQ